MIARELSPGARGLVGLGQARRKFGLSPIVILRAACLGLIEVSVVGRTLYFRPDELAKLPPAKRKAG